MNMSGISEINTVASNENEPSTVEMTDAATSTTKKNGDEDLARPNVQRIHGFVAAAGIETPDNHPSQRRHYSEVEEAYINAADLENEADEEKIVTRSAAGIETKIENYENKRTQRRHFYEATADGEIDDTEELNATNVPTEAAADEIQRSEEAARVEKKAEEDEIKKTEDAARVEKKIVEDCEGVRTQRRHFPGSTTSNIFN